MPFASIHPTKAKTNPWNFRKYILRIGEIERLSFFWVRHFEYLFFASSPWKSVSFLGSKDGSEFWWLSWFPAQNNTCTKICNTVHVFIFLPELRVPKARFRFPVWIQHWSTQQKTCPVWYNPRVSRNCQWYIRYVHHKLWSCSSLWICKKYIYFLYIRINICTLYS